MKINPKDISPFKSILLMTIIATVSIDVWNVILDWGLDRQTNWSLVGRWFGHLLQGEFVFAIPQSAPVAHEEWLGWVAHYLVGFLYAAAYYFFIVIVLKKIPKLSTTLIFAWTAMVFPFFLLQPAMGMGIAADLTPNPWLTRLITFSGHTMFGIGLYLGYLCSKRHLSVASH